MGAVATGGVTVTVGVWMDGIGFPIAVVRIVFPLFHELLDVHVRQVVVVVTSVTVTVGAFHVWVVVVTDG